MEKYPWSKKLLLSEKVEVGPSINKYYNMINNLSWSNIAKWWMALCDPQKIEKGSWWANNVKMQKVSKINMSRVAQLVLWCLLFWESQVQYLVDMLSSTSAIMHKKMSLYDGSCSHIVHCQIGRPPFNITNRLASGLNSLLYTLFVSKWILFSMIPLTSAGKATSSGFSDSIRQNLKPNSYQTTNL